MKGIVIASHGRLAEGLFDSAKLFFGEQEQFAALCIHGGDNADDFYVSMKNTINAIDSGTGVLVMCDILSGTPCNCAGRLLEEFQDRLDIVCGVNLPMVLQALTDRASDTLDISTICAEGASGIMDIKAILEMDTDDDD